MDRRDLLKALAGSALAACTPAAPRGPACPPAPAPRAPASSSAAAPARAPAPVPAGKRLRVLSVGAHPDDPESGCGGTLARYAEAGHDVNVLYVTKGELGIVGKTPEEAGAIRAAEAEKACRALGAKAHFLGEPAGTLALSRATTAKLVAAIDAIGADVIFGQWPFDTDYDHQVTGAMTVNAYLAKPRAFPLYMYEVESGTQTLGFVPRAYVEIGPVLTKKIEAIRAHASQDAERRLYERHHEPMERFRAREIGGTAAEAFAVLAPDAGMESVPGLGR